MSFLANKKVIGIQVFLEKRKTRKYVGELIFDEKKKLYIFDYDKRYIYSKNIISLGPELPLTQKTHYSKELFLSFIDRIPSRENPAYVDYCYAMGISEKETNPMILLATVGRRGPSSFIFEPLYEQHFDAKALKMFREELGLTTREFAYCFDITQAALVNIEQGKLSGNEILKRLEIYAKFPEVAYYQFKMTGGMLHSNKQKIVVENLTRKIAETRNKIGSR